MDQLNEKLLAAWLRLSTIVSNERLVSDMPYNEALICNLLHNSKTGKLCATDLCTGTGMLKSQMNRTLNSMEEKGLIRRERSKSDKRQIYVMMEDNILYEKQHEKTLCLVDRIIENFGASNAETFAEMMQAVSDVAEAFL